jgi:hypothetical protein
MTDVHIFWDNSNIFIPAKYAANRRDGPMLEHAVRIQFDNIYRLASAARDVATAVCVGSVPPELEAVWGRLEQAGVDVELYERGSGSGTEQGIDQCLQVHMLRALADSTEPSIAVLLTGDGAGYEDGAGFHADLERMAKRGWGIEVLSWDMACNKRLKEWAKRTGVYIPLDSYYDAVTFIEKGRRSKDISLTGRPTAKLRV